jgi:hypothetical protein
LIGAFTPAPRSKGEYVTRFLRVLPARALKAQVALREAELSAAPA